MQSYTMSLFAFRDTIALMTILFTLYEHHVRHVRCGCLDCFSTTVTDSHTLPVFFTFISVSLC